ncbi:GST-like protein [Variovorax sp. CF079]|uniref:glutathione S-transferase N-terminal domain-containing protein n=1 Tax=Variovorax sp. CF079 TaxID=1882774 RepID=UPI000886B430|nr:glutathione S-transferase N-terminal domain-containing protein [Variovorax sp. CF079]SDC24954.1 GST-like protein [Variovorax sp. CF079]
MIDLYSWPAPNGHKAHIVVEELGIPYRIIPIDITSGAQHEENYRAINPNGKIPAIVDHAPLDGGEPVTVFETGAILLYLAEKEGRFIPSDLRQRSEVIQWLFWQVGGLGPMMGQAQHFFRYASESVPYGVSRYQNETRRLLKVMDDRLEGREYLCGTYSIADMACFPWIRIHKMTGVALSDFPRIEAWYGRVRSRPAVGRAMDLLRDRWVDVTKSAEAKRNLFRAPD